MLEQTLGVNVTVYLHKCESLMKKENLFYTYNNCISLNELADWVAVRGDEKPEKSGNFVISLATMHPMMNRMCLHEQKETLSPVVFNLLAEHFIMTVVRRLWCQSILHV